MRAALKTFRDSPEKAERVWNSEAIDVCLTERGRSEGRRNIVELPKLKFISPRLSVQNTNGFYSSRYETQSAFERTERILSLD